MKNAVITGTNETSSLFLKDSGGSGLTLQYKTETVQEQKKQRIGFKGLQNWILYSEASTGNSYIYGNLGIGKDTPTAKLDVAGDAKIDGKLTVTGNGDSSFTGNVGIGTAKPTERLSVDGRITAKGANIMQEDWRLVGQPGSPDFQNNWKNYFKSDNTDPFNVYNTAGYFKDSMGIVHLKGMVMKGNASTIFILPAGYRPIARELFACLSADLPGRVDVLTNGEVTLQKGNADQYVSLDGLTFRAGSK